MNEINKLICDLHRWLILESTPHKGHDLTNPMRVRSEKKMEEPMAKPPSRVRKEEMGNRKMTLSYISMEKTMLRSHPSLQQ